MKTYKLFTEGLEKWKDVKNPHVKKEAGKLLKALDKNEVLAYSAEHGEFTIFKNEMEYIKAQKGKGKAMKWLKVEGKSIDGQKLEEAFSFKGAVKHGFLDKSDEKYVKDLKKKLLNPIDGVIVNTNKNTEFRLDYSKLQDERDELVEDVNHLKRWKSMYIKIFWTLFTGAVGVATFLIGESIINR